jgi:hypothetical protein
MEISHYPICLIHSDVLPGDIILTLNNQVGSPISPGCGSPTSTTAFIYLRPFESNIDSETQFNDGMVIGWGVVAAMAVAWTIQYLRRAL